MGGLFCAMGGPVLSMRPSHVSHPVRQAMAGLAAMVVLSLPHSLVGSLTKTPCCISGWGVRDRNGPVGRHGNDERRCFGQCRSLVYDRGGVLLPFKRAFAPSGVGEASSPPPTSWEQRQHVGIAFVENVHTRPLPSRDKVVPSGKGFPSLGKGVPTPW